MKLSLKESSDFLNGTKFSAGIRLNLAIEESDNFESRVQFIENFVKNKNVIHVGCCDHIPLIKEKIKKNIWLHALISKSATNCIGIDIDAEAVKFVEKLGYSNLICADLLKDDLPILNDKDWDIMVLGEILEHVPNPVEFLQAIHKTFKSKVKTILITVPNGLTIENFKGSLRRHEYINSDHYYWFTPYTLARILVKSNFVPQKFTFAYYNKLPKSLNIRFLLMKALIKNHPSLKESLIMIADF